MYLPHPKKKKPSDDLIIPNLHNCIIVMNVSILSVYCPKYPLTGKGWGLDQSKIKIASPMESQGVVTTIPAVLTPTTGRFDPIRLRIP